jgi:CO/xanthine dehydrogenase Mo-binding subunit
MTDLARMTRMDRRGFVKALGGGILILVSAPALGCDADAQGRRGYPTDINAYLHIAPDGKVTLFSGKIEMGQGIMTSLAQEAAEELGAPFESFTVVAGDTASCPWDAGTWGSMSTRFFGPAVRAAAAQARLVLTDLAARRLGVPRSALTVQDGVVYVTADRRRHVSFGELAQGRAITHTVNEKAVLRSVSQFTVMGTSAKRLDGREKVTGRAKFAGDIRLPGMLYARIVRPPAHGATPKSLDTSAAAAMPGVTVVNHDGLVAVLAPEPETAAKALDAVKAAWDVPAATVNSDTIYEHLVSAAPGSQTVDSAGDLDAGAAASVKTFDTTYYNAYVAHAPMEPHTAVAEWKDGRVTIWASTQSPFGHQAQAARALNVPLESVRVITPYVGGGFGGKGSGGQVVEAARLAQIAGKPVMVAWTRAEEFFLDTYRPAAVIKVRSGVDAAGHVQLWDYSVYAAGSRGSNVLYDFPNRRVRAFGEQSDTRSTQAYHPFATGPWRAPGANSNRFAAEQQVDVMAAAAGVDPLEFRLRNTKDPRMVRVLRAAAEAYGWQARPFPARTGSGRGLAFGEDVGTYVVHIADVTVDKATGAVKVTRVVCAQDMGIVVNPDGAKMQTEGSIAMGLGYALSEGLKFDGGRIDDTNFDTYAFTRFSWVPPIEVTLVKNDEPGTQGGGEPGIINMGAVVANAIFDATGARVYYLPMTPQRVLAALRAT